MKRPHPSRQRPQELLLQAHSGGRSSLVLGMTDGSYKGREGGLFPETRAGLRGLWPEEGQWPLAGLVS